MGQMTILSESNVVLILGDYAHFQESMLVKALDFASIRHTEEPNSNETLAIFWNPWCRINLESILPSVYTRQVINGGGFNDSKKTLLPFLKKFSAINSPSNQHNLMAK